jgi:hypothetical protein
MHYEQVAVFPLGLIRNHRGEPCKERRERAMNVARWIRVIAGTFVLASLLLGLYVNKYWFLFTAFVGLNLFQSGITKWCLMEDILRKLGVPEA